MTSHKILLVEDEAIISIYIKEVLNNLGYDDVTQAYSVETATELLTNKTFDLILMDIDLDSNDESDGIDLISNIVNKKQRTPFIYISGNSDDLTLNRAQETKPNGFIVKPFKELDIKVTLQLVLHNAVSYNQQQKELDLEHVFFNTLTSREKEVLEKIYLGLSNKMIADVLNISPKTVSIHRGSVMKKLNAKNAADLIRISIEALFPAP